MYLAKCVRQNEEPKTKTLDVHDKLFETSRSHPRNQIAQFVSESWNLEMFLFLEKNLLLQRLWPYSFVLAA